MKYRYELLRSLSAGERVGGGEGNPDVGETYRRAEFELEMTLEAALTSTDIRTI